MQQFFTMLNKCIQNQQKKGVTFQANCVILFAFLFPFNSEGLNEKSQTKELIRRVTVIVQSAE
jgi:hypothetical protein